MDQRVGEELMDREMQSRCSSPVACALKMKKKKLGDEEKRLSICTESGGGQRGRQIGKSAITEYLPGVVGSNNNAELVRLMASKTPSRPVLGLASPGVAPA